MCDAAAAMQAGEKLAEQLDRQAQVLETTEGRLKQQQAASLAAQEAQAEARQQLATAHQCLEDQTAQVG